MVKKPISIADILNSPGIILDIAALLLIIGAIAPWYSGVSGWDIGGGKLTIFIALIMLSSAAVSLGYIRSPTLELVFPILSVSVVTGFVVFFGGLTSLTGQASWGLYLTILAGLVTLFAAYQAFIQRTRAKL
ncbi:MAG: hypothetical protein E3I12_01090 [Hadesarchaea archaeon]|nr:MAG: hypothetical protein E3I12_01090 [Hadesarchaea archaeon]